MEIWKSPTNTLAIIPLETGSKSVMERRMLSSLKIRATWGILAFLLATISLSPICSFEFGVG